MFELRGPKTTKMCNFRDLKTAKIGVFTCQNAKKVEKFYIPSLILSEWPQLLFWLPRTVIFKYFCLAFLRPLTFLTQNITSLQTEMLLPSQCGSVKSSLFTSIMFVDIRCKAIVISMHET